MRKLKELYSKKAGFFNSAFAFAMMVVTADIAQNVALRIGEIPCIFTLGQPKMPTSLLEKISE